MGVERVVFSLENTVPMGLFRKPQKVDRLSMEWPHRNATPHQPRTPVVANLAIPTPPLSLVLLRGRCLLYSTGALPPSL